MRALRFRGQIFRGRNFGGRTFGYHAGLCIAAMLFLTDFRFKIWFYLRIRITIIYLSFLTFTEDNRVLSDLVTDFVSTVKI